MNTHRSTTALAALSLSLVTLATAAPAPAGPVAPPAGPITPTMKPLDVVEPRIPIGPDTTPGDEFNLYRITQPGSYYLTADTDVATGGGIQVAASNVTIDLMGFALRGGEHSYAGIDLANTDVASIAIRNGVITGWGTEGVDLFGADSCILSDLQIIHCGGSGLRVGANSIVSRVASTGNAGDGIRTGANALITDCIASGNMVRGIACLTACTVTNSRAVANAHDGILVRNNGAVINSVAAANGASGIFAADNCTITGSSASENAADGIFAHSGVTIEGCTAARNLSSGISIENTCRVIANTVTENGADGAGILVRGDGSRLEDNHLSLNAKGVSALGTHNTIVRNTLQGNTAHLSIAPGNIAGPIVNSSESLAAGGPWINFGH